MRWFRCPKQFWTVFDSWTLKLKLLYSNFHPFGWGTFRNDHDVLNYQKCRCRIALQKLHIIHGIDVITDSFQSLYSGFQDSISKYYYNFHIEGFLLYSSSCTLYSWWSRENQNSSSSSIGQRGTFLSSYHQIFPVISLRCLEFSYSKTRMPGSSSPVLWICSRSYL